MQGGPLLSEPATLISSSSSSSSALPLRVDTANVPIFIFSSQDVEEQSIAQLKRLAESVLPVGFVSAMPDVHLGAGATIGSVFASEEFVCPNAVGADIGCGMTAIPVNMHKSELTEELKIELRDDIKLRVPSGFNKFDVEQEGAAAALEAISRVCTPSAWLHQEMLVSQATRTRNQLGTLGGGNHFVEVLTDESDMLWIMLHSGSRATGKLTADHYNNLAKTYMKTTGAKMVQELPYFPVSSEEGRLYLQDMTWCMRYAFVNREIMLNNIIASIRTILGRECIESRRINAHHNFCELTPCSYTDPRSGIRVEKDLWITRKGATAARVGQYGIIPGSMGVGSFIVQGKGCELSWNSCSHGAGRTMSRTAAKKTITANQFRESMTGILYDDSDLLIDEAPMAYKNLDIVMQDQKMLVDVVHRLIPLINIKGF